jgi:rhodanese-related sulfurtransferase
MATQIKAALAGTDWVAANLEAPGLRILDVDEDTQAYGRGHIPGALGVHWRNDLQDPLRRDFIGAEGFAALTDRLGVTNDSLVILYGGNNNWFAAYAYWYFKYYGHQAVQLMDGGRKKWELEGRELVTEVPAVSPAQGYAVQAVDLSIRALRDQMLGEFLGSDAVKLIDVRLPEEYRGELLAPAHLPQEQAQRHGCRWLRAAVEPCHSSCGRRAGPVAGPARRGFGPRCRRRDRRAGQHHPLGSARRETDRPRYVQSDAARRPGGTRGPGGAGRRHGPPCGL